MLDNIINARNQAKKNEFMSRKNKLKAGPLSIPMAVGIQTSEQSNLTYYHTNSQDQNGDAKTSEAPRQTVLTSQINDSFLTAKKETVTSISDQAFHSFGFINMKANRFQRKKDDSLIKAVTHQNYSHVGYNKESKCSDTFQCVKNARGQKAATKQSKISATKESNLNNKSNLDIESQLSEVRVFSEVKVIQQSPQNKQLQLELEPKASITLSGMQPLGLDKELPDRIHSGER
jgi:hypothetical protein